jgi:hypothetical protein
MDGTLTRFMVVSAGMLPAICFAASCKTSRDCKNYAISFAENAVGAPEDHVGSRRCCLARFEGLTDMHWCRTTTDFIKERR